MAQVVRSAMLSMRVTPAIKYASEKVLQQIGMSMTEAIELFLRRLIVDQRIPFEIAAIDPATYTKLLLDWEKASREVGKAHGRRSAKRGRSRPRRQ
jgi:addiction module RelB/DinJ family antitoxin